MQHVSATSEERGVVTQSVPVRESANAGKGGSRFGLPLILFSLLLGLSSQAQADMYCSEVGEWDPESERYVVDGDVLDFPLDSQFKVDADCEFRNWQPLDPSNINYPQDAPGPWLIVFDNVHYDGNLACTNVHEHKFWAVNSTGTAFEKCIDFLIPYEYIDKQSPQPTASIGEPFTYTLTLPTMYYPIDDSNGGPSGDELHSVFIWDDLTAVGVDSTVDLTYLSHTVSGLPDGVTYDFSDGGGKYLTFDFGDSIIPAGSQVTFEITVVLDDTANNVAGDQFVNTAEWEFGRLLYHPDHPEDAQLYDPLPGASGVSAPMTITAPDLVVTKNSSTTSMNLGQLAEFTVHVQNEGGGTAWDASVVDDIPAGMCDDFTNNGTAGVSVGIYDATGDTELRNLTEAGGDYVLSWEGDPTCRLSIDLLNDNAAIAPNEQLIISYSLPLDEDVADQSTHTNVAVASDWYSSESTQRKHYGPYTSTDGSETYADAVTVTATLSGYFFKKTVRNETTGESPATSAVAGDTLHYTLTLENFNVPSLLDIEIFDDLGELNEAGYIVPGSLGNVTDTFPDWATVDVQANGGSHEAGVISISGFDLGENDSFQIEFDVTVGEAADGSEIQNQAHIKGIDSATCTDVTDFTTCDPPITAVSDDPNVGELSPLGEGGDITTVAVDTPGALLKENDESFATIGKPFTYTVTIPATPVNAKLYDVEIHDNLADSAATMRYVDATVIAGGSWNLINAGTPTDLVIKDEVTGIDIDPGEQVEIQITVMLDNVAGNAAGLEFDNTASYSYSRVNGGSERITTAGSTTVNMTVVEPDLTADKSVYFVTPVDKNDTNGPATVGDVLGYTVTITNNSVNAIAYDTSVVDILPEGVSYVSGSAEATYEESGTIDGFNHEPDPVAMDVGTLVWGAQNGDGSLDIPPGETLNLTYRVTVESVTDTTITNEVYVDWNSWDGTGTEIRTGEGCATAAGVTEPNTYCTGPVTSTVSSRDDTALAKSVSEDSYDEDPASTGNEVVRVGDTATYELVLSLQEYTTKDVVVTDELPAGMEFVGYTIDDTAATFNYTLDTATDPEAGDTGSLSWSFGDIENVPSFDDTPVDTLTIRYTARVVTDDAPAGVDTNPTNSLTNTAVLTYTGSDPDNANLTANATVDVLQPQMSAITKVDLDGAARTGSGASGDPYEVIIANDEMRFRLESCNDGQAPAYGVALEDDLARELDETDLDLTGNPVVSIYDRATATSTTLTQGSDFSLTLPARDGVMEIVLGDTAPVEPDDCIRVDYTLGFHLDVPANSEWNNLAALTEYNSLPASAGRFYRPADEAAIYMTNPFTVTALSKSVSPTDEITIGEVATFEIVVPETPVNASLENVVVTDTLDDALLYQNDAAAVFNSGASVTLNETVSGTDLSWDIAEIPAGEQVTITFTVRVDNNSFANAGEEINNTAAYVYDGMNDPAQTVGSSDPLRIVEPSVSIGKTVTNTTKPGEAPDAGDILQYSVSITADGGAAGDDFSDAFDLHVDDMLSLGLLYQPGTATVDGTGNTIADPVTNGGDGVTTEQILTWSLSNSNADIDVTEGGTVTVTYDVVVLESIQAGQVLENSVTVKWTGIDGPNGFERDGTGGVNDYYTEPATTTQTVPDNTTLTKTRLTDTWSGTDVRVGDIIDYELRIHLDEGSHSGLSLSDTLPRGLRFEETVSINGVTAAPYAAAAPFSHDAIPAPSYPGDPTAGPTTVTWSLGDVINQADNDPANDEFVIVYRARVLNDVFVQTDSTPLPNSATLDYTIATGAAALSDSESVTLLQPNLSVSKTAAPAGGDEFIDAGETITFTVDVINNGAAPAYDTVVEDTLPSGLREGGVTTTAITLVGTGASLPLLTPSYDGTTGVAIWDLDNGTADAYTIPAGETLRIEYTVQADAGLGPGFTLSNRVVATDYYSFDDEAAPVAGSVSGVREQYGPTNTDSTTLYTQLPGGPLKENPDVTDVTIGDTFTYTVTVPQVPQSTALHDVTIHDDLAALPVDVTVVSIDKLSGSQTWTPVNTGGADNLVIEDTANGGITIPANEQIQIGITLRLDNTTNNNDGETFANTASYTYNQVDGDDATEQDGGSSTTGPMTVVEPLLNVSKTATPLSTPITGGSVIEYRLAVDNTGSSTAYDVNVVDTLPPELELYSGFTPTATIDGADVGFDPTPAGAPAGPLVWGRDNGDGSLDVPAGEQLVITYQAQVLVSTAATFSNEVWVDWTSLDGSVYERDGTDCLNSVTGPDDYCAGPASTSNTIADNNSLTKSVIADSYVEAGSTAEDSVVRIGDTVTYRLELSLGEGTTPGVTISDVLPQGLRFDQVVSINGDAAAPYSASAPFSYSDIGAPSVSGDPTAGTSTVQWDLGDVTNEINNDGPDTLVIEYQATVLPDAGIPHDPITTLTNTATLGYVDGGGTPVVDPARLEDQATITVRQPVMDSLTKTDRLGRTGASGSPLNVDVINDTMQFRVGSCNTTGQAPAYGVELIDDLPSQLDEGSISNLTVYVGGAELSAGDYNYTPPAGNGGTLEVQLNTPVNPGQCVTVDYDIGFNTDIVPNDEWSNSVTLEEYWSLPLQSGQEYAPLGPVEFHMTNQAGITPLSKRVVSPADEITIGELVTYEIVVPATPVNAALNNVQVTDTLHDALLYQNDATAVFNSGADAIPNEAVSGQELTWDITQIPAGEQITITFTARVDNNAEADAGVIIGNSASYTYADMDDSTATRDSSEELKIVEPELAIGKTYTNLSNPGALPVPGDILQYSVTFEAGGGAVDDDFSDAFDLLIEDTLSLGLSYVNGSSSVDGAGNSIDDPATNGGDGIGTAQVLTWSLADNSADIDVEEGTTVTVAYEVEVLDSSAPGQELTNSATVQWTGIDGDDDFERDGTGTPDVNDYFTGPATTTVTAQFAVDFTKSVINTTTGEDPGENATPGDTLEYTLTITNRSVSALTNAAVVDELAPEFVPGSLNLISVSDPGADSSNTSATGGANGTGIIDVRNITLAPQGEAGESVTIVFEATLESVIPNDTTVLNIANVTADNLPETDSNQTSTQINSAPQFEVWKTSEDITGDTTLLMAGDTLRYTITIQNVGTENAHNVSLRDQVPSYTSYVADSTTLNGNEVADPAEGVSPLQDGMLINAPEEPTPGLMYAAESGTGDHVATITFEVVIDDNVADGTVIANQGLVNAESEGTGNATPEALSDDPDTATVDDPTRDVVGALPLVDALKTVEISNDLGTPGVVDPGDELLYTITVTNYADVPATGVTLLDETPDNTTYVADSVTLNGIAVGTPDGGVSPLADGIDISSDDLTPPLPAAGAGTLSPGGTATVTFKVTVNNDGSVGTGDVISNQGLVQTNETPAEPTDADGIESNGYQPTEVIVGAPQQLAITKDFNVIGGGTADAGDDVEYVITVTNTGSQPAHDVVITDDLDDPLAGQLIYDPDFTTLNGSATGVSYSAQVVTADYGATYGSLPPGESAVLRFRARIEPSLANGTIVTNTGVVSWNADSQSASASVSFPIGSQLSGTVWRDVNNDKIIDDDELKLADWTVEVYRNTTLIATVVTDANGEYTVNGLVPNNTTTDMYNLRFVAPGAGPDTAPLGVADSPFEDGLQRISQISIGTGSTTSGLNLPVLPNGVVYNSMTRTPVAGATLTLLDAAGEQALPSSCFDAEAQQGQVTLESGFYRFDLNFNDPACSPGGEYLIEITPPSGDYEAGVSQRIPPQGDGIIPFSVPACIDGTGVEEDANTATAEICEVVALETAPPLSTEARTPGTDYYLHLLLDEKSEPVDPADNPTLYNQLFNNHIPLDPVLNEAVGITKTAARVTVSRGEMVPYTITVNNRYITALQGLTVVDNFPAGFKYVEGSGRFDGEKLEPVVNGNQLRWENIDLGFDETHTIKLLLVVGSGVSEGDYVNRAHVVNAFTGAALSEEEATATVRVVPDPTFDCTDIIGKVFDDKNLNGVQDEGEKGLPGARVVTARGLIVTSDEHGRFHITCAMVPDEVRGSNFILKLDDRSLPTGYRVTTENPRVKRATRGKMLKFNFGATIHRAVRLDVADAVYEPDTATMRSQWQPRIGMLLEKLKEEPSVLRISYLADVEDAGLVRKRVAALKEMIASKWEDIACCYELTIETEVYWRRGGPPKRKSIID
ncbi:MAG: isopeptide-forming domain-containing fimbrial protein [Pseudomonadota bacterium]